ncbi:uncharacterized protein JN550_000368 [Neoarthrinium moseri]|uniref:uncharacterized protein n=1 Tax=Neoarthrinium moseri TaxID=1658444 RepID=UPI001FDCFECB|nr:uncharacterized protein JN550_000368 [Neoarthrinium moseri]KAI1878186.1 hypothetical protein JN550_000368 [Neoarthrinium moseri]
MACRSCRRHLATQLSSRQSLSASSQAHQQPSAAFAWQSTRRATAVAPLRQQQQQQQRRGFGSTSQCQKSWIPEPLRKLGGLLVSSTSQPYQVHAATETIYKTCAREANYTISETDKRNGTVPKTEEGEEIGVGNTTWHKDFDLPPTFSTWSQVTMLHLYLVYARLRNLPPDAARSWQKQLTDHFFFDAEERMDVTHGISARGLRHRYLKDLFVQWRGVILSYDEGVARGDAALAAAVWRNVYKARPDVDVRHLAAVTAWVRLSLKSLDQMPDDALFFSAAGVFRTPASHQLALVDAPARELEGLLPQSQAAAAAAPKSSPRVAG